MNTANTTKETLPAIGQPYLGGFFAGLYTQDGEMRAVIVAPKAEGQVEDKPWIHNYIDVPGAKSFTDGLANTNAMVEAGSKVAQWARDLRIGGHDDWHIPALDQQELIYRNLKPTAEENYCYMRSGINLHAVPPTLPYTPDSPVQTTVDLFQSGCAEAYDPRWYWTSTQYVSDSDHAWSQGFNGGNQNCSYEDGEYRVRAVRSVAI